MSTENIITIVCALLGSSVVSSIVANLMQARAERRKKTTGTAAGVRMILYDRVKFLGLKYLEQGYIYEDALKDVTEMHRIYHDELKGNGFLDDIMERVKQLPIKRRKDT